MYYLIKVIQSEQISQNILTTVLVLQKPGSEIEILLRRQEAILKQLSFLKEQMFVLREELTKKDTNKSSDNKTNKDSKTTNPQKLLQPTWVSKKLG